MNREPVLLPLSSILRTEEVCPRRVGEVLAMIQQRQAWTHPICIEDTIGALLDGHHRFAAAQILGLKRIPVFVFDYAQVELASWRVDVVPTREEVLSRALSGELFPRKTTRHVLLKRIVRQVPLSDLRRRELAVSSFASSRSSDAVEVALGRLPRA